MKVEITPSTARGSVMAPPSKSMAHRYLICAALTRGVSKIYNVELSKDIKATLQVIKALGAEYSIENGTVTVKGAQGARDKIEAFCFESGSTLRMLLPVCLTFGSTTLSGEKCLFCRPLDEYQRLLTDNGINYTQTDSSVSVNGSLKSGKYKMNGNVSSQFISGMLFALANLNEDSEIELITPLSSAPYVDMTIDALKDFGITVTKKDNVYKVHKGEFTPREITVEGDYSNAAFLLGFNYIGGNVEVDGLDKNSLQGDKICIEHFEALKKGKAEISLEDCPDLAPVLFAVAAANHGGVFYGTERLKIKESDRGAAMKEELEKFSVAVEIDDDKIIVGNGAKAPTREICSHNDHRIVMATSLLCSRYGGTIEGAEAVNKSWPSYFDVIKGLGIEANINDT